MAPTYGDFLVQRAMMQRILNRPERGPNAVQERPHQRDRLSELYRCSFDGRTGRTECVMRIRVYVVRLSIIVDGVTAASNPG